MPVGSGRKIVPIEIKKARGTYRKDRDKQAPKPSEKKPSPPAWLNKRAKQIFWLLTGRLNETGRATRTYTEIQALCASRMAEVELFDKTLEETSYVYITNNSFGDQVMKARPEVAMRKEAMRHVHALLAEMGLTHTAGLKVGTGKDNKKKNEFDGY